MRRLNWNVKRDKAEGPIVEAARQVGAEVWRLSGTGCPDLLVRFRGVLSAGEVKTGKGRLTKSQGAFPIWRTPEDMLRAIGAQTPAERQEGAS